MSWIKMTHALWTAPEVVRIVSALKADRLRTVGALYVLWCIADMHAEYLESGDGLLPGYTLEAIDDAVGWPGFAAAVVSTGWLKPHENGLILPHFARHNGASAKRRAMDADRKSAVRKMSASEADKMRTREEKRRVEKIREDKKSSECSTAAKPAASPEAVWGSVGTIRYVVADSTWQGITPADLAAWAVAYPAVDIPRQLAAAAVWIKANPQKGKKSNYARFLASWLSRDQDRGGGASSNGTHYAPAPRRTMADIHREREKGEYPED